MDYYPCSDVLLALIGRTDLQIECTEYKQTETNGTNGYQSAFLTWYTKPSVGLGLTQNAWKFRAEKRNEHA